MLYWILTVQLAEASTGLNSDLAKSPTFLMKSSHNKGEINHGELPWRTYELYVAKATEASHMKDERRPHSLDTRNAIIHCGSLRCQVRKGLVTVSPWPSLHYSIKSSGFRLITQLISLKQNSDFTGLPVSKRFIDRGQPPAPTRP